MGKHTLILKGGVSGSAILAGFIMLCGYCAVYLYLYPVLYCAVIFYGNAVLLCRLCVQAYILAVNPFTHTDCSATLKLSAFASERTYLPSL